MNDHEYLTIMSELKFIGSVGENQFINLTNYTIENKNLYTTMIRKIWYKTENGQATAKHCKETIVKALKLLDRYVKDQTMTEFAKTIQKYIQDAKVAIEHLTETHKANTMAFVLFDSIIITITQRIGGGDFRDCQVNEKETLQE